MKGDQFGDVHPCSKWQGEGKDEQPGFRYAPAAETGFSEWDFPCVTYDPRNKTSKKEAMKAALKMGVEEMTNVRQEIEKEIQVEKFKESVQRHNEVSGE